MKLFVNERIVFGTLALTLLFYTLLPYLDKKFWHAFVPEHQHWGIGRAPLNAARLLLQTQDTECDTCDDSPIMTTVTGETIIHAPSPSFDLQFFSILIGLFGLFVLRLPRTLSQRIAIVPLLYESAILLPPEPPPTC